MSLTVSKTAFEIARNYRRVASKLEDYIIDNFDTLSNEKRRELASLSTTMWQLGNAAVFAAAQLDLENLKQPAERVKVVTANMANAIDRLDSVEKLLVAATSAVALVGAIATGNAQGILAAAADLALKVKEIAVD